MEACQSKSIGKYLQFGCLILIIFVTLSFISSCGESIENIDYPDEELIKRIEADYTEYLCKKTGSDPETIHAYVHFYYGIYDECVAVVFEGGLIHQYPEFVEKIAGVKINYGSTNTIKVWCDGNIFTLQEAYDAKLLSKEEIKTIANIHNRKEYIVYNI